MIDFLKIEDCHLIYEWRNSLSVRQSMINSMPITYNEHMNWCREILDKDSKVWFIYSNENDVKQAVIYFNDINYKDGVAKWGIYKNPISIRGVGKVAAKESLNKIFIEFGFKKIIAEVKNDNTNSIRFHESIGFSKVGEKKIYDSNNTPFSCTVYELTRGHWLLNEE